MKVRIVQQLVGPTVNLMSGDVVDLPDAEAVRLVEAGIAEAVPQAPKDERATPAEAPRKAVKR